MRSLLISVAILLMTAATASAHGRFFFGVNLGFPLYYPYSYPAYSYSYPAPPVYYPAPPVYYPAPPAYYYPGWRPYYYPRVYHGYGYYPGPRYGRYYYR